MEERTPKPKSFGLERLPMINAISYGNQQTDTMVVGPEEVLLQITLAFMVFLGFLVSDEVVDKTALKYQVDGLQRGLADWDNHQIAEVNALRLTNQKYELLVQWWEQRSMQPLFRLTAFYQDNTSPLYKSKIDELRENPSFKELHRLSNLLFGANSKKNLQNEIDGIVEAITGMSREQLYQARQTKKGLDRRLEDPNTRAVIQSGEIKEGMLQIENVDALVDEIRGDFEDQRRRIGDIQYEAYSRLLKEIIEEWPEKSLEQVIRDWDEELPMLPEVKKRLESKSTTRN